MQNKQLKEELHELRADELIVHLKMVLVLAFVL